VPDAADLHRAAAAVSSDLRTAGIRRAPTDSHATAAHGYGRATREVDLLGVAPAIRTPAVFEAVRKHGFEGEDRDLLGSLRSRKVATLRRGPVAFEGTVPTIPYHETLVDRAPGIDAAGGSIPCASAEDLTVVEMTSHRCQDAPDAEALGAATRGRPDVEDVRRTLASIVPPGSARRRERGDVVRRLGEGRAS
jgi:hypothetical protein